MDKLLRTKYELTPDKLRYQCDEKEFTFKDTSQVSHKGSLEELIIGQEKAIKSIKHGLLMKDKYNNIFATGPKGTGKSTILSILINQYINSKEYEPAAQKRDIVAMANFENPDNPRLMAFEAGKGENFVRDIHKVIQHITERGMAMFNQTIETSYLTLESKAIMVNKQYEQLKENLTIELLQLQDEIKSLNHNIREKQGKDPNDPDIDKLNKEKRKRDQKILELDKQMQSIEGEKTFELSKFNHEQKETQQKIEEQWIKSWVKPNIAELGAKYKSQELATYLKQMGDSLEKDVKILMQKEFTKLAQKLNPSQFMLPSQDLDLSPYKAKLLFDSSKVDKLPIIIEREPTLENLFGVVKKPRYYADGKIERKNDQHLRLSLDKKGSYFKAHGGYLILDAITTILNGSWGILQKCMLNEKAEIQEYYSFFLGLDPVKSEGIETKVKVILKGPSWLYHLLSYENRAGLMETLRKDPSTPQKLLELLPSYKGDLGSLVKHVVNEEVNLEPKKSFSHSYEESFKKIFKVKAEFDYSVKNDKKSRERYTKFISHFCNKEKLKHLTPKAVSRVVEQLARDADSQDKLSLFVGEVENLIREANKEAMISGSKLITEEQITKAIKDEKERHDLIEEKIREYIDENIVVIESSGEKIGELNGLAVLDTGDIRFGEPSRITASLSRGKGGIKDIHEKIELSGPIKKMGDNILNRAMKDRYLNPLSEHDIGEEAEFDCTLVHEQAYSMIDGDSASSTGLYVALSKIGQFPLDQSIAVTGRVSQPGEVQAIGGVNEKIEGFYKCCKIKGLTGEQGVMIPKINEKDLMLSEEVIGSIKKKEFHIYSVSNIKEGLEVLAGIKMDAVDEKVKENLKKFAEKRDEKGRPFKTNI